eukprot:143229_1
MQHFHFSTIKSCYKPIVYNWYFNQNNWKSLLNACHGHEVHSSSFPINDINFTLKSQRNNYTFNDMESDNILLSLCCNNLPSNIAKINVGYHITNNKSQPFCDFSKQWKYQNKGTVIFDQCSSGTNCKQINLIDCKHNNSYWKQQENICISCQIQFLYGYDENNEIAFMNLTNWHKYFPTFNATKLTQFITDLQDIYSKMDYNQRLVNKNSLYDLINEMKLTVDFAHGLINIDHLREKNYNQKLPYKSIQDSLNQILSEL